MGVIASRQRAAEDALLAQRQRELQIQELNKLNEIRAKQGQSAINAANQPLLQFDQAPGQAFGTPSAAPQGGLQVPPSAGGATAYPVPTPQIEVRPLTTTPAAPAATAAPAARPAGLRTPEQLLNVPTEQLSVAEFQALPDAERVRRLQFENQRRQAAIDRSALGKAPAAAADIFVGGPVNAVAQGGTWLANQIGVPRLGRALGIYDPDVTRVEIPTIGSGTATPYYDMVRQAEQANRPLTEAQLIENLRKTETQKATAAEKTRSANAQKAVAEGYADWMLDDKGNPVRGLRNNNPGNIKFSPDSPWKGSMKDANGNYVNDGEFVRFDTPEAGIRAMTMNLMSYNNRGVNTIRGIVNNWTTTDRASYTKFLTEQLGVKPDDVVDVQDPATMEKLVRGIIQMENGKVPYDARTIETGIALGFNQGAAVVTASNANAPRLPSPTQQVATAVQSGNATQVATAASQAVKPPAPATSGTMQGPAALPPNAQNPEVRQLLTIRSKLQEDVKLYAQYGMGDKAWETVGKIQALDLGMYKNQADWGVYEGATTGNFSRAMSVLSTFTNAPHQVLQRPDGNYDLYINGQVAKNGVNLTGPQVEQLVRSRVDAAYRAKLAEIQTARGDKAFESELKIREESSKQYLQGVREANAELIKGNFELAKKKMENAGFKATALSTGQISYSNPAGEIYIIDPETKTITIGGNTAQVGPTAARVSGINTTGIWSAVNAPQQVTER
jgi:hypothetical protein